MARERFLESAHSFSVPADPFQLAQGDRPDAQGTPLCNERVADFATDAQQNDLCSVDVHVLQHAQVADTKLEPGERILPQRLTACVGLDGFSRSRAKIVASSTRCSRTGSARIYSNRMASAAVNRIYTPDRINTSSPSRTTYSFPTT